jgi:hypothetical protein
VDACVCMCVCVCACMGVCAKSGVGLPPRAVMMA